MRSFITAFLAILLVWGCSGEVSKGKNNTRPKYEITVAQKGAELGKITLITFPDVAPKHAKNFDSLVKVKFYDGLAFHRLVPNFVIQGGDPNTRNKPKSTWGMGSPGLTKVPAEFSSTLKHIRGTLSAARSSDPNSATTQFFLCVANTPQLDGKYSIYGKIVKGIKIVDVIVNSPRDREDKPYDKITMTIKRID